MEKTNRKVLQGCPPDSPQPTVLVGRDCRLSSPELANALILSLRKEGLRAVSAGLAPSPLCYFLLYHYRFSATAVITASHNPKNYNGFKIMVHGDLNIPDPVSALKKLLRAEGESTGGKKRKALPPPQIKSSLPVQRTKFSSPHESVPFSGNEDFSKIGREKSHQAAPPPPQKNRQRKPSPPSPSLPACETAPLYRFDLKIQDSDRPDSRGQRNDGVRDRKFRKPEKPNKTGITEPDSSIINPASSIDIYTPYIDSLKKEFSLKPLPFVVDGGNGAVGPLAKKVFRALGLSPFYLFCEPDGRFPNHHPDPTVEKNLSALKEKVLETKSLFGVGWDGDGDRVGVVTGKGRFVSGDELGFLFLPSLLNKNTKGIPLRADLPSPEKQPATGGGGRFRSGKGFPISGTHNSIPPYSPRSGRTADLNREISNKTGSLKAGLRRGANGGQTIIVDVKCSNSFLQAVRDQGGEVILSKSGHRFARRALETHRAIFAVEFSGHIFFNDRPGRGFDDALYATLRLLELLTNTPDMETLLPPVNPFKTDEIRLPLPPREITLAIKRVKSYLQSRREAFNALDGARVTRGKSWALFRDSKTQNILSMRFEAGSKKELNLLQEEFSEVMKIPLSQLKSPRL